MNNQFKRIIFIIILFFVPMYVFAHPHAFITMKTKILAENQQLVGFSMEWTLDAPSSAAILYDIQQERRNKNIIKKLADEAITNIVNEHYFTYLFDKQGNKIKYSKQPKNYGIRIDGNQVSYYFDFYLSQPRPLSLQNFTLMTYDETYYVSMYYDEQDKSAVDFSQVSLQCRGKIIEPQVDEKIRRYANSLDQTQRNEDNSLGQFFAQRIELVCH